MECPEDPYNVGFNSDRRDLVKKAFNALINASGRIQQFNNPEDGPVFDEDEIGMSWNKFLDHIKSYHPKLKVCSVRVLVPNFRGLIQILLKLPCFILLNEIFRFFQFTTFIIIMVMKMNCVM